jgi:hypothetical protein
MSRPSVSLIVPFAGSPGELRRVLEPPARVSHAGRPEKQSTDKH